MCEYAPSLRAASNFMLVAALISSWQSASLCEELPRAHQENVYRLVIDEPGQRFVSASGDGTALVWDLKATQSRLKLPHDVPVYDAAVTVDDQLVTVAGDGLVRWWSMRTGELLRQVEEHDDPVYAVAASRDGRWLATGGGDTDGGDTTVRLWDAAQGQVRQRWRGHTRPVYGLALSRQGTLAASASGDKTICLGRPSEATPRCWQGHRSDVYRCDLSPNEQLLATCSQDGTVRCWDIATGAELFVGSIGREPIYAVVFSPDGRWLASCADDGRLRIYDTEQRKLASEVKVSDEALYTLAWLPDSQTMLVAGAAGKIWRWHAEHR